MSVTPEDVLKFQKPTDGFLCPLSANTFGIDFVAFKIRNMETNDVLFETEKDPEDYGAAIDDSLDDSVRFISYTFPKEFLDFKTVGTTIVFRVGDKPVPNFRMIERHYFRDRLLMSYDFTFGFCIPNSTNSRETIYDMPRISAAEREDIVAHPFETRSDSFYFVNDKLVMHNKAEYSYSG